MGISVKRQILFVLLFAFSLLFQVSAVRYIHNFPDISLLLIVFAGIYLFSIETIFLVVIVSFFRSFFSQGTLLVDAFLMPCVCIISYLFSKMFNGQNILFQMFITVISFITVITVHTLYFSVNTGNHLNAAVFIDSSWSRILLTSIMSPVFFLFYREYFRIKW